MSSSSDPSAPAPASGCATPVRLPPVLPPEPRCCSDDPIQGLKQLFVDYFQGRGMSAGRDPSTRPVFLRPHGAVQGADASSTELDHAGGERWLAAGDAAMDIEHRLTRPKSPQTNGMVERFNGRISQVLNTNRFESGEDLEQTLIRYIWLYNHHLPQKALSHETPLQALNRWQSTHPELFVKQVRDRPGSDS